MSAPSLSRLNRHGIFHNELVRRPERMGNFASIPAGAAIVERFLKSEVVTVSQAIRYVPEVVAAIVVVKDSASSERLWGILDRLMPAVGDLIKSAQSSVREYENLVNAVFDRTHQAQHARAFRHSHWAPDTSEDRVATVREQSSLAARADLAIDATVAILDKNLGEKFISSIFPVHYCLIAAPLNHASRRASAPSRSSAFGPSVRYRSRFTAQVLAAGQA